MRRRVIGKSLRKGTGYLADAKKPVRSDIQITVGLRVNDNQRDLRGLDNRLFGLVHVKKPVRSVR